LAVKTSIQFETDNYFPVSKHQGLILQKKNVAIGTSAMAMASCFSVSLHFAHCEIKQVNLAIFFENELRRSLPHMGRPSPFILFPFYC